MIQISFMFTDVLVLGVYFYYSFRNNSKKKLNWKGRIRLKVVIIHFFTCMYIALVIRRNIAPSPPFPIDHDVSHLTQHLENFELSFLLA